MSYQVIARKWRPQKFDDVVGQQAVTRTLRNALASGRLAQAFVFAGPRGVGKTTTARILARALNCVNGPTADPCGDVRRLRRDRRRARHRRPRDRRRHAHRRRQRPRGHHLRPRRSCRSAIATRSSSSTKSTSSRAPSFNALLKSIEEPPPHVVFMMATTELEKIPETVLSRSQVYEFRTISTKAIADQLRRIVDAEGITVGDVPTFCTASMASTRTVSTARSSSSVQSSRASVGTSVGSTHQRHASASSLVRRRPRWSRWSVRGGAAPALDSRSLYPKLRRRGTSDRARLRGVPLGHNPRIGRPSVIVSAPTSASASRASSSCCWSPRCR